MTDPLFTRLHTLTLTCAVVVLVVFAAVPEVDIALSALLTDGAGGFIAAQMGWPQVLNAVLRRSFELVALGLVVLAFGAALLRVRPASGLRCWAFLAAAILIGPGLIVNLILKEHSGRARPMHIEAFGGDHLFSPMLRVADQCLTNCSFTSGEAALTSAMVFAALALGWPHFGPRGRRNAVLVGVGLTALVMFLRVALGRHFVSDVLASTLISAFVCLALYRLMGMAQARHSFTAGAIAQDLVTLRQVLARGASRGADRAALVLRNLWGQVELVLWPR